MKVCYFIQSHRSPEQIYRLVRTIKQASPSCLVVIGHDFTSSDLDITPLKLLSDVHLLRGNAPSQRGRFSLLHPYLNAINWLLDHDFEFDWLVYLSAQDYPVKPLVEIENCFRETAYDGFIRYWDINSLNSPWINSRRGFKRYFYQYYDPPQWTHAFLKKISKTNNIQSLFHLFFTYGVQIGIQARSVPFNQKFVCYGGSQWHSLSRKCVQFLKEFIDSHPELVHFYQRTICPDESFVQTILANSQQFNLCNDHKRYVDLAGSRDGHPRVLTVADYSVITSGDFHFARKFDLDQDAEILDQLDARILGTSHFSY